MHTHSGEGEFFDCTSELSTLALEKSSSRKFSVNSEDADLVLRSDTSAGVNSPTCEYSNDGQTNRVSSWVSSIFN